MTNKDKQEHRTAFDGPDAIDASVKELIERTKEIYLADDIPWVVGYSGGKDSTATAQLIWGALADLSPKDRSKPVHIISTDTLVENPIVAMWVGQSLKTMQTAAEEQGIPIIPHRLTPEVQDRFWVNLVGKGYPTPRPKFRWCTSRLKISPSNKFITDIVKKSGEAILVLGTRKSESAVRSAQMKRRENEPIKSTRAKEHLGKNADPALDRVWVYTPVAEWSNDDVWEYLVTYENPWGYDNSALLGMYRGATKDNECPLVIDSSTPSCGDSRFGCYVCTMVDQDKSMMAMIQNDDEKHWMSPLLELRNKWLNTDDRKNRDYRRMNGSLLVHNNRLVHGPYKQEFREKLLAEILKTQIKVRELGPPEVQDIELLRLEDLEEIRRIWVMEKHEIEDRLPSIYQEATGVKYPIANLDENQIFKPEDLDLLKEICTEEGDLSGGQYELLRELLHLEQKHRTMARRSGLFEALDKAIRIGSFDTAEEAEEFALRRDAKINEAKDGAQEVPAQLVI